MHRNHRYWTRSTAFRLATILLLGSLGLLSIPQPAAAAPVKEEQSVYNVAFLPSNFFRLCVGDKHTYAFMVSWVETQNPEPVPVDENGLPLPVPLKVHKATVTASHGVVQPSEFIVSTTPQVFRFQYTAESEGAETFQVNLSDGASGQGSKSIRVIGTCAYKLSFFAKEHKTVETGGFEVVFQGRGDFQLDRTAAGANSVTGNGTHQAALGMWAEVPQAFTCDMVPMRSSSTYKIEGTLQPDYGFMTISLRFDPMTFPGNMHFDCSAMGLGNVTIDVPVGEQTGDANDLDLAGLTFPITGGTEHFQFGSSQGVVVVTLKK